nr:hypothetical protein [Halorubrum saccharovorum]
MSDRLERGVPRAEVAPVAGDTVRTVCIHLRRGRRGVELLSEAFELVEEVTVSDGG